MSFPAMGTWIEIPCTIQVLVQPNRRSLQWERGLKCRIKERIKGMPASFPAMGTWIEMKEIRSHTIR